MSTCTETPYDTACDITTVNVMLRVPALPSTIFCDAMVKLGMVTPLAAMEPSLPTVMSFVMA